MGPYKNVNTRQSHKTATWVHGWGPWRMEPSPLGVHTPTKQWEKSPQADGKAGKDTKAVHGKGAWETNELGGDDGPPSYTGTQDFSTAALHAQVGRDEKFEVTAVSWDHNSQGSEKVVLTFSS